MKELFLASAVVAMRESIPWRLSIHPAGGTGVRGADLVGERGSEYTVLLCTFARPGADLGSVGSICRPDPASILDLTAKRP